MAASETGEIYPSYPGSLVVQVEIDTLRDKSFGPWWKVDTTDFNTSDLGVVAP